MGAKQIPKAFVFFLLGAALAASLYGQEYRGRIQGSVLDTSQAAIVGAKVTLLNVNTNVSTVKQTDVAGHYLFDMVDPGTYTVTVEFQGFEKFVQENVLLLMRGDITVDATLRPGSVRQTVTVTGEVAAVQFDTGKLETDVNTQLADNIPLYYRTTFLLAQLDPAVEKDDYSTEQMPYHSWGSGDQKVGGGQPYTNDLQVDGVSVGIGYKTSYVPSPDMVQEVNVQQNAIDAEYGHSSGSAISITLKSGTNAFHGTLFYQGQYPWANALEDRVIRTINMDRNNMYGGTLGHPILKNKLFNFVAFEGWHQVVASDLLETLPTAAERTGDFSQSLNGSGALRTIYDPWSTTTSANGVITRTAFTGNVIPTDRLDPIAVKYTQYLWNPNRAGIGPYGVNNYYAPLPITFPYKNFSDRADYVLSEKIRVSGRFSMFKTPITTSNPTGSPYFQNDRGSERDATSITEDLTYTLSPQTVINIRGDYHHFVDASKFATNFASGGGWAKIWPTTDFYAPIFKDPHVPILIPRMSVTGTDLSTRNFDLGPTGGYWDQRPSANAIDAKIARQQGPHYLKAGFETRGNYSPQGLLESNPGFGWDPRPTNSTYVAPNTLVSGDGFASFLLGAVVPMNTVASDWDSGTTSMPAIEYLDVVARYFSLYINDDWKVSRNLTLNLGLRYEFAQAWRENQDRIDRPLDLTTPIPVFQGSGAPQMPALVQQYYTGPWIFNGSYHFASSGNRGEWDSGSGVLSPRIGAAYRLNSSTSLRAAYGRYVTPWQMSTTDFNSVTVPGYTMYTGAPPMLLGVPQMQLQNPFPSTFPITPDYGKSYGQYTGLGDTVYTYRANRPLPTSDRYNFSVQRQLPEKVVLDVTYFLNFSRFVFDTQRDLDMVDPRIAYTYKSATNLTVANPFYNILPVNEFPGPLGYEPTVSITSLMKPYPQYVDIQQYDGMPGGNDHYQSLQLKLTRNFSKGYCFLFGYNYHYERDQRLYDDIATYLQQYTWMDSPNSRHRLSLADTVQIPFGKGRPFMTKAPRVLDALVGGWNLSTVLFWRSGRYPEFGGLQVYGDPVLPHPNHLAWFNASAFSPLPAYTPRNNPWLYPNIMGPGQFNMDASLVKAFHITEKFKFILRMDSFNVINNMTWEDPDTNVYSSTFGMSAGLDQLANTFGRRTQLGMRLEF